MNKNRTAAANGTAKFSDMYVLYISRDNPFDYYKAPTNLQAF